jgi:hypothetical protein
VRADRPVSTRRRLWIAENKKNATLFRSNFPGESGFRERLRDDSRDGETVVAEIVNDFYRDELTLYSRENITNC